MNNRYTIDSHGYILIQEEESDKNFYGFTIQDNVYIHTFIDFGSQLLCNRSIKAINCNSEIYDKIKLSIHTFEYQFDKLPKYTYGPGNPFPNMLFIPDDSPAKKTFYSNVYYCGSDGNPGIVVHNIDVIPEKNPSDHSFNCNERNFALLDLKFSNEKYREISSLDPKKDDYTYVSDEDYHDQWVKKQLENSNIDKFTCGAIFLEEAINKIIAYNDSIKIGGDSTETSKPDDAINIYLFTCLEKTTRLSIKTILLKFKHSLSSATRDDNNSLKLKSVSNTIKFIDDSRIDYNYNEYPKSSIENNNYRVQFSNKIFIIKFNLKITQEEIFKIKDLLKNVLTILSPDDIQKIKNEIDLTDHMYTFKYLIDENNLKQIFTSGGARKTKNLKSKKRKIKKRKTKKRKTKKHKQKKKN